MTMKLLKLHVQNFRSLRDVTWEPGDLNVLIGPNAGGKSNLLKAIDLLSAAANGELREHVTREGGIGPLTWNGDDDAPSFDLALKQTSKSGVEDPRAQPRYVLALDRIGKTAEYLIPCESLTSTRPDDSQQPRKHLERDEGAEDRIGWIADDGSHKHRIVRSDDLKSGETLLSLATGRSRPVPTANQFRQSLGGWTAYQSLRTDPEAAVRWSQISRRETVVGGKGGNLVSVLHTLYSDNSAFEGDLNDAMHAAFGDEFVKLVFSPDAADQRIQFKVRWKSLDNPVPASDLSDGTLRYLYLLAILANPNPPSLIAIDEPETGLHPRMLTYIAEFAVEAARRTQVVFTTHSAAFLDALNRFNPTTTVVEAHNSETRIKNVSMEILSHWLKEYTLGDLFRSRQLEAMT